MKENYNDYVVMSPYVMDKIAKEYYSALKLNNQFDETTLPENISFEKKQNKEIEPQNGLSFYEHNCEQQLETKIIQKENEQNSNLSQNHDNQNFNKTLIHVEYEDCFDYDLSFKNIFKIKQELDFLTSLNPTYFYKFKSFDAIYSQSEVLIKKLCLVSNYKNEQNNSNILNLNIKNKKTYNVSIFTNKKILIKKSISNISELCSQIIHQFINNEKNIIYKSNIAKQSILFCVNTLKFLNN